MGNQLPVEIGKLFVYKETGVLTIEEKDGFSLQCNMLFNLCTLKLSGNLMNFFSNTLYLVCVSSGKESNND